MPISGLAVAYTTLGGIILWSGIKGETLTQTIKDVASGKAPATNQQRIGTPTLGVSSGSSSSGSSGSAGSAGSAAVGSASGGPVTASTVTTIQNYGLARLVASTYGWASGNEWASLTEVINRESGGNPNAMNPSGAYGIAQALGHGTSATRGTVTNEYGGYGVPTATCISANSGNASAQLVWMMAYIKETYGDPVGAWQSEESRGFY
jgi:Transglycosylase SLT domain